MEPPRWLCAAALSALLAPAARAQLAKDELPEPARGVEVVEKLGERIPSGITVRTSAGEVVDLRGGVFEGDKPVLLTMVYYDCPLMCPLVMERMVEAIEDIKYRPGEDFKLVVVSFDPTNTDEMAREARERAINQYALAMASDAGPMTESMKGAFRFHTASGGNARKLGDAIGFNYKQLPNGEYSHPAAMVVLSPDGRVSRYLNIDSPERETVEVALLKASRGGIAKGLGDWFQHVCFAYDPDEGAYTLQAMRVMQIGAGLTVVLLGGLIGLLFLRGRLRVGRGVNTGTGTDAAPDRGAGQRATGSTA